jgi:hypothetical protein
LILRGGYMRVTRLGPRIAIPFTFICILLLGRPLFAQIDLSGEWVNLRNHEEEQQEVGDFSGLPINAAALDRADSWTASLQTLPEHQCQPHGADGIHNFGNLRIWKEMDPLTQKLTAYHLVVSWMTPHRIIYMDGRPHPPEYAAHTFQGFSTGSWDGNVLTVNTTHLKADWLRRNGVPRSEKATLSERFVRHGDYLTWVIMVNDPVYLTEPYVRSVAWHLDPTLPPFPPYPCDPVEEVSRPAGQIPHYLPGANPFLTEWTTKYHAPPEAGRGGAVTMYPEFMLRFRQPSARAAGGTK